MTFAMKIEPTKKVPKSRILILNKARHSFRNIYKQVLKTFVKYRNRTLRMNTKKTQNNNIPFFFADFICSGRNDITAKLLSLH